ncbi:peptide/nickel transport system permease protein [Bradyrhizobium sp. USDA 4524]|uniref:ABC transporter permease n=1 Tax=unclassified Bradyrhizobium TaxID=2631580 RepID=UPI00209E07D9|nr:MULTISPECIES: ABC transporter permease [unclassified Bradyrhizobium]MCP1845899.1 peptide/nickel transport system permease protein [Bradyrhizobium sp. USDA 4538]MCP1907467.1 peptide/nickel transport system permease protein [Bradyrhizobium sp. USDA 4537]MCP1985253.1 peptide/nickel transport system permease protein [Bradyrhizobium sp. USDA 4539]
MISQIVRRLVSAVPVLVLVGFIVFSILYVAPGDPAVVIAGDRASPEEIRHVREMLGLDRPFLVRFAEWFWHILHGDLGHSVFNGASVTGLILDRLGATMSLMLITMIISVLIAVPLGVAAAWRAGGWIDRMVVGLSVIGFSVPVFVFGYILAYIFSRQLQWLPVQGYKDITEGVWPWLRNLILPSLTLSTVYIALIARVTRASMLEVLGQDYIRTARAKGASRSAILFVHALKNAGVPIITVIGIGVALLIGGAVVTETVFAIPGLGRLTLDAIAMRDYPIIQGVVLVFSFAYVIVNLIIDISYVLVDPRIRYR